MPHSFLKPEVIAATSLELLRRDIVLPRLVWTNAVADWNGKKNDTVTLRVPARLDARTRALRPAPGSAPIQMDDLLETGVNVTLDENIYSAVRVSDENLTLDIRDFAEQVLAPQTSAVAYGIEAKLAAEITGAPYLAENVLYVDSADIYDVLVDVRARLNANHTPKGGRVLVVGSDFESAILKSDHFNRQDAAGAVGMDALTEATITRLAGFDIVSSGAIPADEAYAFERSAFVLSLQAPLVPNGVPFGASVADNGLAMRHIRDYDATELTDRSVVSVFAGSNYVADGDGGTFVRAVKIGLTTPAP